MRILASGAVTVLFSATLLAGGGPDELSAENGVRNGLER